MDQTTRDFAVETTAQIGVLRAAVTVMMADLLRQMPAESREEVLDQFVVSLSEVPPGPPFATPEGTQFFELVAEAMPSHAERFVRDVRSMLG
ncbi:hypothetical protein B2G69_07170 [Methylorubrum zatmanii]|nr:hypothetical protein [Methylorubrum zatmanii]ARO53952.1 hypothetical protein B2G69_07170 [Methylorubrum zatmanii]